MPAATEALKQHIRDGWNSGQPVEDLRILLAAIYNGLPPGQQKQIAEEVLPRMGIEFDVT